MSSVKSLKIEDFGGGLYSKDPTIIPDNALQEATNVYYDTDEILTVRRGSDAFSVPVPDAVVVINDCNATTNFAVSDDAVNLIAGTAMRGTFSVQFGITVATSGTDSATLSNATLGAKNITSAKGYLGFWLYLPSGYGSGVTTEIRLGTDSSNYYAWALPTVQEGEETFVVLDYADATVTGTVNDANINYFAFVATYTAGYTDQAGIRIDSIISYSATSSLPQLSIAYHEKTTGVGYLICNVGTTLFLYNSSEDVWEAIDTGLVAERFKSGMYKDILYITKKSNDYRSFNGTAITTYPLVPRAEDLVIASDVGYLGRIPGDMSTLFYTNASPVDLTNFPNFVPVDEDNGQVIVGIDYIGPLVIIGKERSTYQYNVASDAITPLDYSGGFRAARGTSRVLNDLFFYSDNGIFALSQRSGTVSSLRADSVSEQIQSNFVGLDDQNACMFYWPKSNNVYFSVDRDGSGANNGIYVYSIPRKAWTVWEGVSANDFCVYFDNSGQEILLAANPFGGQTIQLETGFTDQGNSIEWAITTKTYDFGNPGCVMLYTRADLGGFHTVDSSIDVNITCVNTSPATVPKTIIYQENTDNPSAGVAGSDLAPLGAKTLASAPLGGGVEGTIASGLTLYPFFRYMPICLVGRNIKFRIAGQSNETSFALTKLHIHPTLLPKDFVPNSLYT